MIAGLTTGTELSRFKRSTLGKIAILAVTLMPLMYSALYLWAFWNPFGNVDKLPIAFVNADRGTVVAGEPLNAGDKITEALKKDDRVHFTFTNKEDAINGVKRGDYYFAVELAPDFSEAVASPASDKPHQAVINTVYNDANGYLSTLIGENVMRTMLPVISQQIGAQSVDKVLVGIQDAGSGLTRAADGAQKLNAGAVKLRDGLNDAADGAQAKLITGSEGVNEGAAKVAAGASQLADGTSTLRSSVDEAAGKLTELSTGVDKLAGGVDQLADGAQKIDAGVNQLASKLAVVTDAQATTANSLDGIAAQLAALPNVDAQRLAGQVRDVSAKLRTEGLGPDAQATADVHRLVDGTGQLAHQLADNDAPFRGGFNQLHAGTGQLPGKLTQLTDGVHRLDDGAHALAAGASKLHDEGTVPLAAGAAKLTAGLKELADGSVKLAAGTDELSTKLHEGSTAVPHWSVAQREGTASVLGGPVALNQTNDAGTNTFGAGLAPFFFSLAMFIGGLIIFLLLRPMHTRAIASGVTPLRAAVDGFIPGALIAAAQATIIVAVTEFAVGLHSAHPLGLWGFAVMVSVMFTAINQFLNVALGPGPGKVCAMALLMLQILASGGLYPVETEPRLFEILHPINPMTYAVNGFRQLMYGAVDHRLPQAFFTVAFIVLLSLVLTALCARRDRMWTIKRLHPPIKI